MRRLQEQVEVEEVVVGERRPGMGLEQLRRRVQNRVGTPPDTSRRMTRWSAGLVTSWKQSGQTNA